MNLVLVTGSFPERSETFIYRKARALAARGHDVTVLTRKTGDWGLYPEPLPPNLRVEVLPPDHSLRDPRRALSAVIGTAAQLARLPTRARALWELCHRDPRTRDDAQRQFLRHLPFVERRADAIHFEFLSVALMYPLVRSLTSSPIVVSCRGSDLNTLEMQTNARRDIGIGFLREANGVHCVSNELANGVARIAGRRDGVWVNRAAVDIEKISEKRTRATGPLKILATGRLVWQKGFEYLLSALARVAKHGVAFHAEIVGDGEMYSSLRFSIGDLGLDEHVSLVGALTSSEVLARMQTTDIFVLSSVSEGISNAALEAMASGIPVVTTAAGGMPEAVTDGVEGYVVPVRDIAGLADRITRLAEDPTLRHTLGRAARLRAEREFSLVRQAEVFESIYRSIARAA